MTNIQTSVGTRPLGMVENSSAISLADRDFRCSCTWVAASLDKHGNATFRLKYRHANCLAPTSWHNSIMGKDNDDMG